MMRHIENRTSLQDEESVMVERDAFKGFTFIVGWRKKCKTMNSVEIASSFFHN